MICTKCGKEIPDGSLFCPECGIKLEPAPDMFAQDPMNQPYDPDVQIPPVYPYDPAVMYDPNQSYDPNAQFNTNQPYDPNMQYQQYPQAPKKPIPKKAFIIGGAIVAAIVVIGVAFVLVSSALQSKSDKDNEKLYQEYSENLEDANQQALDRILDELGGTTSSASTSSSSSSDTSEESTSTSK